MFSTAKTALSSFCSDLVNHTRPESLYHSAGRASDRRRVWRNESIVSKGQVESRLANLSHTVEAARIIESSVAARFKRTSDRQIAFAQPRAICVEPIVYEQALAEGCIDTGEGRFTLFKAIL